VDQVLELATLTERADDRLRGLSKGMQQRAMIAQALLAEPELLILDEPTSALDPHGRRDVRRLIETVASDGTTVVLNSHILSEVEAVCSSAAIIQSGRVVRTGSMAQLKGDRLLVRVVADGLDDASVQRLCDALGAGAEVEQRPDGRVTVAGPVMSDREVPRLADIVHEAGGRLFELNHDSESLEDVFMRLTGPPALGVH
jgi:ABC-2 type transport system ATP-binding protein